MDSENVSKTVEQLLQRKLSPIEKKVLILSWEGQSYKDIEENTGYVVGYLRDIGSNIWKKLSDVLQQRVTKKNLSFVLEKFRQSQELVRANNPPQEINNLQEDNLLIIHEKHNLSFPSAPIPSNSLLYVQRPPLEKLARQEIARKGCLLRIKAPQRMGKSSILNQIIAEADRLGYQVVYLDFNDAEEATLSSIESLLSWFCAVICQQLNLHPNLDHYWDKEIGSKMSCKLFLENYILEHIKHPIVLIINELNNIFEYPRACVDFLALLRSFHEQSRRSATWHKLRLVLAYSTDIYVRLKINQSPFNVGLSLKLSSFNKEQIFDLAHRYGLNWQSDREVQQLMTLIGGHPYLVNIALYYLSQEIIDLETLLSNAHTPTGIYSQHLQQYLLLLQQDSQLASAMYRVVNSDRPVKLDILVAYKLESMGLISLNGFLAQPSYQIYRLYFRETLQNSEE